MAGRLIVKKMFYMSLMLITIRIGLYPGWWRTCDFLVSRSVCVFRVGNEQYLSSDLRILHIRYKREFCVAPAHNMADNHKDAT